jgi:hypothetical protein
MCLGLVFFTDISCHNRGIGLISRPLLFFLLSLLDPASCMIVELGCTGLLKIIFGVLTTCHTKYTWDRSICIFLFNRKTFQVFVTYLTGALYMYPLWFYKHQHDNRVPSTQNAFSLPFAVIIVNCPSRGEMHNYCIPHAMKENFENFLINRCNYILLSQEYCVWQVVKTPTFIFNNPVFYASIKCPIKIIFFCFRRSNLILTVPVAYGTYSLRYLYLTVPIAYGTYSLRYL